MGHRLKLDCEIAISRVSAPADLLKDALLGTIAAHEGELVGVPDTQQLPDPHGVLLRGCGRPNPGGRLEKVQSLDVLGIPKGD